MPFSETHQIMYQSFVTTHPTGPGKAGILTFLYAKPGYIPGTAGHLSKKMKLTSLDGSNLLSPYINLHQI